MKGTSPQIMSTVLQLGIAGSIWYIAFFISLFFIRPPLYPKRNLNMQAYFLMLVLILLLYADFWSYPNFCFVMFTFLFLSWNKDEEAQQKSSVIAT
jgi:hypothetical protein